MVNFYLLCRYGFLIDQNDRDLSAVIAHDSFIETSENFDKHQIVDFISTQKDHIDQMLLIAQEKAEIEMQNLVQASSIQMLEILGNELKRLVRLKAINPNIKQQEVDQFKAKIKNTHSNIIAAKLKLDALRFVVIS